MNRHIHFEVLYNNDRVIEINVLTDPAAVIDVTEDREVEVEFLYSTKWKETVIPFERRMEKYSKSSSLPHHLEVHWFSIINSCVTVLLLTGFLATILMRVLKNDFIKYVHFSFFVFKKKYQNRLPVFPRELFLQYLFLNATLL